MWFAIFLAVVTASQTVGASAVEGAIDICQQPKEDGPCEFKVPRYYYSSMEGRCLVFFYSGCEGNDNNFYSKSECEEKCLKTKVNAESKIQASVGTGNICQLAKDDGTCDNKILRYYYDSSENKCHIFNYQGCFGNANNFVTKLECEKACLKPEKSDFSDFKVESDLSFAAVAQ